MGIKEDAMLKDYFKQQLQKTHSDGLAQGVRAICSVIFDKADDTSQSYQQRIDDIKEFCSQTMRK